MAILPKPDIFQYLDYRRYLSEMFDYVKTARRRFSYRSFARLAGYGSPNLLQLIIAGSRSLNSEQIAGTVQVLGLNKQETDFFENLVGFDHARTHEEKDRFYRGILRNRKYATIKTIERDKYEFFSHWFFPAVRELAVHPQFGGDPGWIAKQIVPEITQSQVQSALDSLLNLELLRKDETTGRYVQVQSTISTVSEVTSLAVTNYHRDTIRLGAEAIDRFPPTVRDIRSVTIGLTEVQCAEIKLRMERFWKELLEFSADCNQVERVVQINMQFFPLSKGSPRDE